MALVCPVGHPAGVGTPYCRLCGRDYLEVADAPAPVLTLVEEPPPVVPQARPEPVEEQLPAPLAELSAVYDLPAFEEVPPAVEHVQPALDEVEEVQPEVEEPVAPVAGVERRLLVLTAAATFLGGLVTGGAAVALLG